MTKDKLQQELLAKIKGGIKPSDLKKLKPRTKTQKQPEPIKTPNPSVYVNKDEGYESDQSDKIPTAPPLPNQNLLNQISSLKKRLTTYQDFKEADLKIKEKQKQEIAELKNQCQNLTNSLTKTREELISQQEKVDLLEKRLSEAKEQEQTIIQLINQAANPTIKQEPTETKTFTCSDCNQQKPQSELSRVFNNFSFCLECSKKARQQAQQTKTPEPQPITFICHLCEQTKQEIPTKIKLDKTLTDYLICSSCKPTAKEFNEAELITDDLWEKYPYSSASEILELEFGIKSNKEKSW